MTLEPGASAARLVEGASRTVHEPAPIPLRRTVASIALETTKRSKSATLSLAKWKKVGKKHCITKYKGSATL